MSIAAVERQKRTILEALLDRRGGRKERKDGLTYLDPGAVHLRDDAGIYLGTRCTDQAVLELSQEIGCMSHRLSAPRCEELRQRRKDKSAMVKLRPF